MNLIINKFRFYFAIFLLILFLQFFYITNEIKFFIKISSIILIVFFYILLFTEKIFKEKLKIILIQINLFVLLNLYLFFISNLRTNIGFYEFFNEKLLIILFNIFIATGFGLYYSNTCDKNHLKFVLKILSLLSIFFLPKLTNLLNITNYGVYHFIIIDENYEYNYSQKLSEIFGYGLILSFIYFFFIKKNLLIFFSILIYLLLLTLSGGRGAFILSMIFIFFISFNNSKDLINKFLFILLLTLLFFNFGDFLMGPYRSSDILLGSESRIGIYSNFYEYLIKENCVLFGCGYRSMSLVDMHYNTFHNIILELIYSFGLPVFIFLFSFSFLGFIRFYKKYGLFNWFNILFIFTFLQSLKSFDLYNSYLIVSFIIFFLSYYFNLILKSNKSY